ncbi:MAG: phosphatidate cytidylyltransferase [Dongiaceae bacterium]
MFVRLDPTIWWTIAGIYAVLGLASILVFGVGRRVPALGSRELRQRVTSWWIMATLFAVAILLDRVASLVFLGFVSFLALKEYLSLIPTRRADRRVLFLAYLAIPVQYWWVGTEWYGMFIIFIPVYMFLLLPVRMVLAGETQGFLRAAGTLHWGLTICVFSLSHAAYLLMLPGADAGVGAGLLLFLVIVTEANDVAQYFWGKLFGRARVTPTISPNKTWAGLIGGIATSAVLAGLLAFLTPMVWWIATLIGAGGAIAGFCGDLVMSAVKRDLSIKDTGGMLPGHGGILDRVDSLVFTAPLFMHFIRYFYY